jgi:hypothetical protein
LPTTERPTLPVDAQPYVAAVRELLWALPADERDELLDDLSSHLAELAAEDGPPLRERLGTPSAYAADFVASAGVALTVEDARHRLREIVRLSPAMRARVAGLRPAWLMLRPFLIALAAMHLLDEQFLRQDANVAALIAVAIVGTLGVAVSQRVAAIGGAWDRAATLGGAAAIVVIAMALNAGPTYVYVDRVGAFEPNGVLPRGDGSPVANIWAYDAEGNPVDVFLFDQNGRPLDDVGTDGYDDRTGDQLQTTPRRGVNGAPIPNLFPREQRRFGRYGAEVDPAPAVSTPRVTESTTTTSTTAPSPTSTTVTTAPAGPPSTP